jgi:serine/threonine-protein kinase RsbW
MPTKTFPGSLTSLVEISQFIVQAAEKAGLDENAVYAVELAVDEACTNIVEHAYGGENRGEITCAYDIDPDSLTIRLHDRGKPFDPKQVPVPKKGQKLKDLKPRGAGVFLIRKLMDEVRYEFTEEGNTLTLVKKRPQL